MFSIISQFYKKTVTHSIRSLIKNPSVFQYGKKHDVNSLLAAAAAVSLFASVSLSETEYTYKAPLRKSAKVIQSSRDLENNNTVGVPKPKVLFVLGGPGAGKGTQCSLLVKEFGFVHLSAGDLLREERKLGGLTAELIESYIRDGKIVPVDITANLLKSAMIKSGGGKFLIDGFPRNEENYQGWERIVGNDVDIMGVLFYDCSEAVMEARLLERGKGSGRSDDNIESIKKRFATYVNETKPIIEKFAAVGKTYQIDAGRPINEVTKSTVALLDPLIKNEVIEYNERLLKSIDENDWTTYSSLVSPAVTSFEPNTDQKLIVGLPFHEEKFVERALKEAQGPVKVKSTMTNTNVSLLSPTIAVVNTNRVISKSNTPDVRTVCESRLWKLSSKGRWELVHFHRS
jgi:UMP-CMP kinase